MRKRLLRFFTCAGYAVTVRRTKPLTEDFWRRIVRQLRQLCGGSRNLLGATSATEHRHGAHQQPQRPNSAAVGIHAVGRGHHLLLAFTAESPYGLSERNIRWTLPALLRQRLKRGGQAVRGALH